MGEGSGGEGSRGEGELCMISSRGVFACIAGSDWANSDIPMDRTIERRTCIYQWKLTAIVISTALINTVLTRLVRGKWGAPNPPVSACVFLARQR